MGGSGSGWRTVCTTLVASAVFLSAFWNAPAFAVSRDYTIDMNTSSIAISGTVFSADLNQTRTIVEQGAGSLTTKYTGTIKSDRQQGTIAFLAGSVIDANVSGNWRPLADATDGTAPADYGGRANFTVIVQVPVYFAGRDLAADLSSDPNAINGSNQFSLAATNLTFTGGEIAYRASIGSPADSQTIVGEGGTLSGNGTIGLVTQGGLVYETLKFPVNATFEFGDTSATISLTLTGEINARALIPASYGDYNQNGVVDGADYVVWRDTSGQTGVGLAADGNGDGQVTNADFTLWRSKFGQSAGVGAGDGLSIEGAVPEPGCAVPLLAAVAAGVLRRGRLRSTV